LYESTHAEAGAYLLGLWGLPPYLIEVLAYHHCPSRARLTNYSILAAVHIADYLDGNSDLDQEFIKSIGYDNKIELFKTNLRE
jgi:HD-like signal output (HDOD) protein